MQTKIVKKILLVGLMLGVHLVVRPADEQTYEDEKEKSAVLVQAACRGALSRMDLNQPVVEQSVVEQERFTQELIQELTQKSTQESAQESAQKEEAQKSPVMPAAPMQSSNSSSSEDTSSDSDESFEHQSEVLGGQAHEKNLIRELHELLAIHDNDVQQAFFYAVQNKVLWAISFLLDRGADVNAFNQHDEAALMWVVASDDAAAVELLLARGAKQNLTDQQGRTPLMLASANGYTAMVERLLAAGAHVNAVDQEGDTALMYATQHAETMAVLRAAGANVVNAIPSLKEQIIAKILGLQIVRKGFKVNATGVTKPDITEEGFNNLPSNLQADIIHKLLEVNDNRLARAFRYAFKHNLLWAFKPLKIRGADIDYASSKGYTALRIAAEKSDTATAQALINAGASIDAAEDDIETLFMMVIRINNIEMARLLINAGVNIDAVDRYGKTALWQATDNGFAAMVQILIDAKAKVDIDGYASYRIPLSAAVMAGNTVIVKQLLAAGARKDIEDTLLTASREGYTEIVGQLIDAGAESINQQTVNQALRLAVCFDRIATAKLLLDRGADIDKITILMYTVSNSNIEIVEMLINKYREQLAQTYPGTLLQITDEDLEKFSKGKNETVQSICSAFNEVGEIITGYMPDEDRREFVKTECGVFIKSAINGKSAKSRAIKEKLFHEFITPVLNKCVRNPNIKIKEKEADCEIIIMLLAQALKEGPCVATAQSVGARVMPKFRCANSDVGVAAALECQQSGVACQAAAAAGAQEELTAVEEREDGPAPTEELMEQEEQMPATAQELRGLLEAAAMARMGGRQ